MTDKDLKDLTNKLWDSANSMRAYGGIKASDYAVPVLGLIFLRFADNKYSQVESEILAEYQKDKGTRMERTIAAIAIEKCGFYLPDEARYDYLLNLPADKSLALALKDAMQGIEKYQDGKFKDVLAAEAYFEIEKKKEEILPELLKTFSDIPKNASGDVFGLIYEYFLGKFAMAEGQKGGQFFTPTSVVRFIVEVIEPYSGKIYDPACGSGGMFVQSAKFIREANKDVNDIYVYGQEFMGETVRLAKMNLMVNNIRGEITEGNSYEIDPYDSFGKFDYVMANPPFNVKSVKESTVKNDKRFYNYGLPKNKGKKDDKITDANYLWISLFATSLKPKGRAGFVMPNSASDARNSEKAIRQKIVDTGLVDVMVAMPSNMFFTVTLPATLWFLDKGKKKENADKILFLDARNTYRQIDRAHREWTADHQQNLATIVRLYRGEKERFVQLIEQYFERIKGRVTEDYEHLSCGQNFDHCLFNFSEFINKLKAWYATAQTDLSASQKKTAVTFKLENKVQSAIDLIDKLYEQRSRAYGGMDDFISEWKKYQNTSGHHRFIKYQTELTKVLAYLTETYETTLKQSNQLKNDLETILTFFDKKLKVGKDKAYKKVKNNFIYYVLEPIELLEDTHQAFKSSLDNIQWLQKRFPKGEYQDVIGLCKIADIQEVIDEQDYSLNAGRYVGVEIDNDNTSPEEFKAKILGNHKKFEQLENEAIEISTQIKDDIKTLFA